MTSAPTHFLHLHRLRALFPTPYFFCVPNHIRARSVPYPIESNEDLRFFLACAKIQRSRSEGSKRRLFVVVDIENGVQLGDLHQVVNALGQAQQL